MTKQEKSEKLSNFFVIKGLTQKNIADALGVSEPCVNALINGEGNLESALLRNGKSSLVYLPHG